MNTLWSKIKNDERIKLVFAYLIIPIFSICMDIKIFSAGFNSYTIVIMSSILGTMLATFPPTILRFVIKKNGLNNGKEIFFYLFIFSVALLGLYYILGSTFHFLSYQDLIAPYLILSYECQCRNGQLPSTLKIIAIIIATVFIVNGMIMHPSLTKTAIDSGVQTIMFGLIIQLALYYKSKLANKNASKKHCHKQIHSDTYGDIPSSQQYKAFKLISLGLAAIGRKTVQPNPYLTPEREAQRHNAERYFLLQLAAKYKDASARKVLAKHFMLYKEACLYIVFASLLKDNPEIHSIVKVELTKQLCEGLTMAAKIRRKEYMFAFSRAFYDEYQRTRSMERVLSFMFWSVLRKKHPELGSEEIGGLVELYRYVYEEVKGH